MGESRRIVFVVVLSALLIDKVRRKREKNKNKKKKKILVVRSNPLSSDKKATLKAT